MKYVFNEQLAIVSYIKRSKLDMNACSMTPFYLRQESQLKINIKFKFAIPRNILFDIQHLKIKKCLLRPLLKPPLFILKGWSELKTNIKFEFAILRNISFDI